MFVAERNSLSFRLNLINFEHSRAVWHLLKCFIWTSYERGNCSYSSRFLPLESPGFRRYLYTLLIAYNHYDRNFHINMYFVVSGSSLRSLLKLFKDWCQSRVQLHSYLRHVEMSTWCEKCHNLICFSIDITLMINTMSE